MFRTFRNYYVYKNIIVIWAISANLYWPLRINGCVKPSVSSGTIVVVFVTADAIVVAADSKNVDLLGDSNTVATLPPRVDA